MGNYYGNGVIIINHRGGDFCRLFIEKVLRQALYREFRFGDNAAADCSSYGAVAANHFARVGSDHYLYRRIRVPGSSRHKELESEATRTGIEKTALSVSRKGRFLS